MNKFAKFLTLPIITIVLAACGAKPTETTTTTVAPETTTVATTVAQVSTPNDTTTSADANSQDTTTVEGQEPTDAESTTAEQSEVAATDVPINIYLNGELAHQFVAKDAVGGNVLSAMESVTDLEFFFDEAEGIVSSIVGQENDYAAETTWVYLLNGEYAEYGVVSQTLSESDTIDWYYGNPDDLPVNITQ